LDHLKKTSRIAWPIKAFIAIGGEAKLIEALKECLNFNDIAFDQQLIDKNYDILCYLRDHQLGDFAPRLEVFLAAHDERLRFAAVEALIEQNHQGVPRMLERFLTDSTSENTRLRRAVLEAFARKGWPLTNPTQV